MSGAVERFLGSAGVLGRELEVRRFPEGTRTAEDAARAIGCEVGQIVKSLVFVAGERPILALTSGSNRVDPSLLATLAGSPSARRATPEEVRAATGFAVGGTPPCSIHPVGEAFIDETLLGYDELWAAAGTPDAVVMLTPDDLLTLSGGTVAVFAEDRGGAPR